MLNTGVRKVDSIETSTSTIHYAILEMVKNLKSDVKEIKSQQEDFRKEIREDVRTIQSSIVTLSSAIVQKQTTHIRKKVAYVGILGAVLTTVTSMVLYIVHLI